MKEYPGKVDRHAILRRHIHRRRSRRSDPLDRHALRGQRDLMILRLLNNLLDQLLVGRVRIRPAHHRHAPQIILKRIVRQLRRSDLKSRSRRSAIMTRNPTIAFTVPMSHNLLSQDRETCFIPARPSNSRNSFHNRRDPNIAYFASRT